VNSPVPSIAERCKNLPPEIDRGFQRALSKDPQRRQPSASAFVAELRDVLSRPTGATATQVLHPVRRRPGTTRLLVPVLLLLLAAGVGAAVAAIVTSGGGSKESVVTRTVAGPGGTTTIRQTVTHETTAAAPAPPPPPPPVAPPPPPPPAAVSGGGHSLNDQGYSRIQAGDYAGAVPLLQSAVQKLQGTGPGDPYEGYANYNLGYALYRLGRCSEAVPYLQRADRLEPQRSEPRQVLQRAERC